MTNKIYKNSFRTAALPWLTWNILALPLCRKLPTGPHLAGGTIDNSANLFAINGSYLYYWDG